MPDPQPSSAPGPRDETLASPPAPGQKPPARLPPAAAAPGGSASDASPVHPSDQARRAATASAASSPHSHSAPPGPHDATLASPPTTASAERTLVSSAPPDPDRTLAGSIPLPPVSDRTLRVSNVDPRNPTLQRSRGGEATVVPARRTPKGAPPSASALAQADPLATEGTGFGRFRLLSKLGAGGMGIVYKAYDPGLRRMFALKQIRPEADSPDVLQRFLREARLAASLRHPNIVGVHEVGQVGEQHYIAMDYVEGDTLSAFLDESRPGKRDGERPDLGRLRREVELLALIGEAVAYAHGSGIIHRDLKPSNVLLDREGRPFVMDFGLARRVDAEEDGPAGSKLTISGQVLGTPSYMSPEQANGNVSQMGPATDVWALGVMLFEVLTGWLPLEGKTALEVLAGLLQDAPRAAPDARNRHVPRELAAVYHRATERDPARRYPSAAAFAEELRRWLRGEPVLAKPPGRIETAVRALRRHRRIAVPAAAALAIAFAAAAWVAVERMKSHGRARELLARIAGGVRSLEDTVMRTEMTPAARLALARQPLELLDALAADDAAYGPTFAWRGAARAITGDRAQADEDFARACELSPDAATVWLLRGLDRSETYSRVRRLPESWSGGAGLAFRPLPPESAEQRRLRESALADLDRAAATAARDETVGEGDLRTARALAALTRSAGAGSDEARSLLDGLTTPRAARVRGDAFYPSRRWDEAIAAYSAGLSEWTQDALARAHRGLAGYAAGLEAKRTGGECRTLLATAAADLEAARTLDPRLADLGPTIGNVRRMLSDARAFAGEDPGPDAARARQEFAARLAAAPGDPYVLNDRALLNDSLGQQAAMRGEDPRGFYAKEIVDLDAALAALPGDALALNNRGVARVRLAMAEAERGTHPRAAIERAVGDFDAALKADPGHVDALQGRAEARRTLGEALAERGEDPSEAFRAALADLDECRRVAPESEVLAFLIGQLRCARGERLLLSGADPGPEAAPGREFLDAWLQENPSDALAWYARGALHRLVARHAVASGRPFAPHFASAVADFDEAIRRVPGRIEPRLNRVIALNECAQALAAQGQDPSEPVARALAGIEEALARAPQLHRLVGLRGAVRTLGIRAALARGEAPAAEVEAALADFAVALAGNPADSSSRLHRGELRLFLADSAAAHGADPRAPLRDALADLDEAVRLRPRGGVFATRASAWLALANAEAARGSDARESFQKTIADADRALQVDPRDGKTLSNRGVAALTLGQLEAQFGADPAPHYARAEADLKAATELGVGLAWLNLGILYQVVERWADAASALERGAAAVPAKAAEARAMLEQVHARLGSATEPWAQEFAGAQAPFEAGDYAAARPGLERSLAAIGKALGALPEPDRLTWLQTNRRALVLANACLQLACIEALLSVGKAGPDAPIAPSEDAVRGQHRDRAFALLGQLHAVGFRRTDVLEEDPDLAPLRSDPRWAALVGKMK